jgi:ribosomal protein S18 acetylase RimI-like enzyme
LLVAGGTVLGYFVAMKGVDEVHLLNITVAPAIPAPGLGPRDAGRTGLWARAQGVQWLWLEVRVSNLRARAGLRAPMATAAWVNARATTRLPRARAKTPLS